MCEGTRQRVPCTSVPEADVLREEARMGSFSRRRGGRAACPARAGGLVLLVLGVFCATGVGGQGLFSDKTAAGSQLSTPPHGYVFPVTGCKLTADESLPRPLADCDTVSFHVLLNHSVASGLEFFIGGEGLRAGEAFDQLDAAPCTEPLDGAYDQKCGAEERTGENRVDPDSDATCVTVSDSCDYAAGDGKCSCRAGTVGKCTCFRAWRFTVQPTLFANVGDLSVCFNASSRTPGAPQEQRCVYFDMLVPPHKLYATGGGQAVYATEATVGQEMRIPVQSVDVNEQEKLSISVRPTSVELPNQRWDGDSYCVATGSPLAGFAGTCPGGVWERVLVYTPRVSEMGMEYKVFFDSVDDGLGAVTVVGQSRFSQADVLPGAACGTAGGQCSAAGLKAEGIEPKPAITVSVAQKRPQFVQGVEGRALYGVPGGPILGGLVSFQGSPQDGERMPAAYVNCEMAPFGVYAFKEHSKVNISLEVSDASPQRFGLVSTPSVLWNHNDGQGTDPDSYYSFLGVTWRPPLGSEGRDYEVCFLAKDEVSSSRLCVTLPVARCVYCTREADTLKEVAERFGTHWLQVRVRVRVCQGARL